MLAVLSQKQLTANKLATTSKQWEAMCALEQLASSMVQAEQDLRPDIKEVYAKIQRLAETYKNSE